MHCVPCSIALTENPTQNRNAPTAAFGQVQIDEVSENIVRGSFEGTSRDSKLDLRGTFAARPCTGTAGYP